MPARVMRQNAEIKELFREKIKEKLARDKELRLSKIDEELPSWISWALKPLASWAIDHWHKQDQARGDEGEDSAAIRFWLLLTGDWILINDVVLEPRPGEFIQVDHVLIGPPGVYLVETKAWEGAFRGNKDRWWRKAGNRWVSVKSPTEQNERHKRLFAFWLDREFGNTLPADKESWLYPVVLFTRARWIKADGCSMPVFDSGLGLAWHMRKQTGHKVLTPEQAEAIAQAIVNARPRAEERSDLEGDNHPAPESSTQDEGMALEIRTGRTRDGRSYVRIVGPREDAEKVRARYVSEGKRAGPLRADRSDLGVWFFYIDD